MQDIVQILQHNIPNKSQITHNYLPSKKHWARTFKTRQVLSKRCDLHSLKTLRHQHTITLSCAWTWSDRKSFIIYSLHHNFYNSTEHCNKSQVEAKRPAVKVCRYHTGCFLFDLVNTLKYMLTSKESTETNRKKKFNVEDKTNMEDYSAALCEATVKLKWIKLRFSSVWRWLWITDNSDGQSSFVSYL